MSKKDYRKVRPIPGTIFDPARADEPNVQQRRMGFLLMHDVNPAAVARGGVVVESAGGDRVRVYYDAIYIPPGEDAWPEGKGDPLVPPGVWCEHGGYAKRHTVKQIRHFDATLGEVL